MNRLVLLVSDGAGWALDDDLRGLRTALFKSDFRLHSRKYVNSGVVFFLNRSQALGGERFWWRLHGNRALNFFHGFPESGPRHAERYQSLIRNQELFRGVRVSSEKMERTLKRDGLTIPVRRIPIPVDTEEYRIPSQDERMKLREEMGLLPFDFVVGSFQKDGLGWDEGLEPKLIKGPDIFCDAIEAFHEQEPNVTVLLSGPGRGYVKNRLHRSGIRYRHVQIPRGKTTAKLYWALDAYMVASRDEGGPKQALEALASGVPLVATPVGQIPDLLSHGIDSRISFSVDSDALVQQLLTVRAGYPMETILKGRETALRHNLQSQRAAWIDFFGELRPAD